MDPNNLELKYKKLATEYSKLRAQASVLKKAVIEEQTKTSALRETLRQKETALRRSEQEVDSLGFRNKQLEHRVASLQDDFEKEINKKSNKLQKNSNPSKSNSSAKKLDKSNNGSGAGDKNNVNNVASSDSIIFEELQKRIMENAELTLIIDEKENEIKLYCDRIEMIEKQLEKRNIENSDLEKHYNALQIRNCELETKIADAGSIIGSEDALSASSDSTTPIHAISASSSNEDRITFLEKELFHWRTQYEILKISDISLFDSNHISNENNTFFNGPTAIKQQQTQSAASTSNKRYSSEQLFNGPLEQSKEHLLYQHFSKQFENLLKEKCMAESRLHSYILECENLQNNLEKVMKELNCKECEIKESKGNIQILDEDLTTTRINYEEQISVLTEQVISLSEQLASSK